MSPHKSKYERQRIRLEVERDMIRRRARIFIYVDLILMAVIALFLMIFLFGLPDAQTMPAPTIGATLLVWIGLSLLASWPFALHAFYLEWRYRAFRGGERGVTRADRREQQIEAEVERRLQERQHHVKRKSNRDTLDDDRDSEEFFIGPDGELFFEDEIEYNHPHRDNLKDGTNS